MNRFGRSIIWALFGLLFPMALPATGQENSANEPASAPAADQAKAGFDNILAEWKKKLGTLRELQVRYKVAKPDERPAMEKQFGELVVEAENMLPQIVEAAIVAYEADPNESGEPAQFLISRADSDMEVDRYEETWRISKSLADKGFSNPMVYGFAGVSAFALNDFDAAEKYLTLAKEKEALTEHGQVFLKETPNYRTLWEKEQKLRAAEAAADDLPRVVLTTNKGDIVIELFENEAPNTVANFISLVEKGFYNNLLFHRVIHGFMAQGGDPEGTGAGGPGYSIACEVDKPNARSHFMGSLSMAHAGRNTGGSQFFITYLPTPHLNGKHTVFGRVIEGMEVAQKLRNTDPPAGPPDKILEAKVIRKRPHEYKPSTIAGR